MRHLAWLLLLLTTAAWAQPPAPVTVNLNAGWNAVGFLGDRVTAVNTTPGVVGLAWFDGTAYQTGPVTTAELNGQGNFQNRRGFFVFANGPASLTYTYEGGANRVITLRGGRWNLVTFTERGAAIGVRTLVLRDTGTPIALGSRLLTTFYEVRGDGTLVPVDLSQPTATLVPGRPYWIFCNPGTGEITLNYLADALNLSQGQGQLLARTVVGLSLAALAPDPAVILNNLDTPRLQSLVQGLVVAAGSLAQGGTRTVPGPQGGTAQISVEGTSFTIDFVSFVTPRATIAGQIAGNLTGNPPSSSTVNCTFNEFSISIVNGETLTLNGGCSYFVARGLSGTSTTLRSNYTATRLSGAFVRFEDLVVSSSYTLVNSNLSGQQNYGGVVAFDNYDGFSGRVALSTPQNLQFNGTTTSLDLTAGQLLAAGEGTVRLTVISTNLVEVAFAPAGTSTFVVLATLAWSALGG